MAIDKIVRNIIEDQAVTQPKIAAGAVDNAAVNTSIITGLTELTSVAENDQLIIHDTSAGTLKKVTKSNTTTLGSPVFTSVSPDNSQTADGGNITFTITGSGFTAGTNARLISNTGVRLLFDSVTRTNTTTISAVIARSSLLVAQSPYDIQVINGEGLSVVGQNKIDIDTTPLFITSAGSLGSPVEGDTVDIEILARDPDSSSAITFEIQSGSLPSGLSLVNNSGDSCRIQGTAPAVSADTTSNFTLRAFDSASNATSRAFSITVLNFNPNGVRFDSGSSDSLTRTPSSASNRKTFTFSTWVKRITSGSDYIFAAKTGTSGSDNFYFGWRNDQIQITSQSADGNTTNINIRSNAVYRDFSAWYHLVCAVDTTQGTSSNRVKLYVNGSQVTSLELSTYPNQNDDIYGINNTIEHAFGRENYEGGANYHSYYLSETVLIDGLQLTPTSFGETDSNGVWIPKAISGLTFGTNGFHLDFADGADLGNDVSGNNNDFTENNITSIDKVEDTPQNNYATFNPLDNYYLSGTFSEGNLKVSIDNSSVEAFTTSTIGVSSGKWYMENKIITTTSGRLYSGVTYGTAQGTNDWPGGGSDQWFYRSEDGHVYNSGSLVYTGATLADGDIVGIALDLDNHKLYFSKNGTFQNSGVPTSGTTGTGAISLTTGQTYFFAVGESGSTAVVSSANFGNPPFTISSGNTDGNGYGNFEYAVPSGYYSLNTKNLAEYG